MGNLIFSESMLKDCCVQDVDDDNKDEMYITQLKDDYSASKSRTKSVERTQTPYSREKISMDDDDDAINKQTSFSYDQTVEKN